MGIMRGILPLNILNNVIGLGLFVILIASLRYKPVDALNPQVPCLFIFGDSLSDSGNNNGLSTLAKANYPPYGIDFPTGTTGRFTNGFTFIDYIARFLGLPLIPPFANRQNVSLIQGINYASGGAGIRPETSSLLGQVIDLRQQLANHKSIVDNLRSTLGLSAANNLLKKCLYSVHIGGNDYISNYYATGYNTSKFYTPQTYAVDLIIRYQTFLRSLYKYGARKFALFGVGQLGCLPGVVTSLGATRGSICFEDANFAGNIFNLALKSLVKFNNIRYPSSGFTFVNYAQLYPLPNTRGFKYYNNKTCCQLLSGAVCQSLSTPCANRSEYIFWDGFHPSSATNQIVASRAYVAQTRTDAIPWDISHLVKL